MPEPLSDQRRRVAIDAGGGIEIHTCVHGEVTPELRDALVAVARAALAGLPCGQPACDRREPCDAQRSGWCAHPDAEDGFGNSATPDKERAS